MTNESPIRAAARRAKRLERFQTKNPSCLLCAAKMLVQLVPVTSDWLEQKGIPFGLMEAHHIVGKAHDPTLTVPLCRNCHALATEDLLRAGVSMRPAADPWVLAATRLEAAATFLERFAVSIREWIKELPMNGRDHE